MSGFTDKFLSTMGFMPRSGAADGYPFDLDGAERRVRPKSGRDYWPTHSNADNFAKLGAVSGFMPLADAMVYAQGYGKRPYGPIVSALPVNLAWQITIPGLTKMLPQS